MSDGHDRPRLIDELVPGVATVVEDVVVGFEDPIGQPVVAHELPDVLDRVELGTFRRKRQDGDVGRDDQVVGEMPPCLIHDEQSVGA